jgi:hypothetical protein
MAAVIDRRLGTVVPQSGQALHVPSETPPFSRAHVTPRTKQPTKQKRATQHREKVHAYRDSLPGRGLRPIQIWAWDTRSGEYAAEAWRQSRAIASALGHTAENDGRIGVEAGVDA